MHAPLSVGFNNRGGSSVLVFSILDSSCPTILKEAQDLGPFTRAQLLRCNEAVRGADDYEGDCALLDRRPSRCCDNMSAHATETPKSNTYAAKACIFAEPPVYNSDWRLREPPTPGRVLCFDFTTQQPDLLPQMLNFPIQGHREAQAVVPTTIRAQR